MKIADISQQKEVQDTIYMPKKQSHTYTAYTADKTRKTEGETDAADKTGMSSEEDGATVAISAEGLGLSQKEREENVSAQEAVERKMYQEMLEKANEAAEAQGEGFADLAKALEIARRILNGDIVPAQDEQFLMEFNSEIYMRVKSMAKVKEDPKEYDTLMEEEEDGASANESNTGDDPSQGLTIESDQ